MPDALTESVIGAAIEVHRNVGPGLLESAYKQCLLHELRLRGFQAEIEVELPLVYKGLTVDCAYRMDLVVEDAVVVELKALDAITPVHRAQLLTYLRLSGIRKGLLMNFHSPVLKDGLERIVF